MVALTLCPLIWVAVVCFFTTLPVLLPWLCSQLTVSPTWMEGFFAMPDERRQGRSVPRPTLR